jgi:hypothetical protein
MRPTLRRTRLWMVGSAATVVFVVGLFAVDPVCRQLAESAARRRSLVLHARRGWPTWSGVRLDGVDLSLEGVPGIEVQVAEASIQWGPLSGLSSVSVDGALLKLSGSPGDLADGFARWRNRSRSRVAASPSGRRFRLAFAGARISWDDGEIVHVDARGISGARGADGTSLTVDSAEGARGALRVDLRRLSLRTDANDDLTEGRAMSLSIAWDGEKQRDRPTAVGAMGAPADSPVRDADVATPLLELPDLRVVQSAATRAASVLAAHVPPGARASIDAVTWRISPRVGSPVVLGPGGLSIAHDGDYVRVDFAAGATDAGPAVTSHLALPVRPGDTSLDLQGGPVPLASLGFQDGNIDLFDVAHTTVSGRAHLAVDADARGLSFDAAASARGLSVRDPRLASDDVRGLDVQLRARGALSLPGELRFDELAATIGALHVEASGLLDQEPDHVSAAFRLAVPTTPCNVALNSIPTALLPLASGMTFTGSIGAEGHVAFDSRSLDDLELGYQVHDGCRATTVPTVLARESLRKPFVYRVYLPDGTTQDEETGPGTPGWAPLNQISPFMETALTTLEDGAFRSHHGFNHGAIRASIIANLKARRFVRGASTLTMQLAKNLFLTRDKTVSRKLEEVILTDYLEQILSKDEILELYLNVVEFGPAVYGITAAADYYFGRTPADLDLAESFFLASLLPSPIRLSAAKDNAVLSDARTAALRNLMQVARRRGLISDADLAQGLGEPIAFWHGGERPAPHAGLPARLPLDGPGLQDQEFDPPPGDPDSNQ